SQSFRPVALPARSVSARPRPYPARLTPALSELRPHCLARDRLRLWRPSSSRSAHGGTGNTLPFSAQDLARVLEALALGYADSTMESYAAGLLLYHVWCDSRSVAEEDRTPVTMTILELFTAAMVGSYSETAVNNY
ncbi:hypothetical protein V8D89_007026, partial [Ganoderma adspersum]